MNSQGQSGNISWSSNGERVDIKYTGTFEFSDDDSDVVRLSPGGYIRISDGAWLGRHSVELRADAQGTITRRYWIGSSEKPFDPEGREWLKTVLPRFINALPTRFEVGDGPVVFNATQIDIDPATGRALAIERIQQLIELS